MKKSPDLTPDERDCWRTPLYLYQALDRMFNFGLDICATKANALHPNFIDEKKNALQVDWRDYIEKGKHWGFCNPPYSKCRFFTAKAREMAMKGIGCVMLVNNCTDTEWFQESGATTTQLLKGRIRFLHPVTGKEGGSPSRGNALLIYQPYMVRTVTQVSYMDLDFYKTLGGYYDGKNR
ncbi:phage N-6-adenine-methyltransferase [Ferrimonas balearica]|uniref:phage N-6-adenine-methyltransferase n=1 Tax=Ferrimonas balearica TaxID=44012 RepID=UPI001F3BBC9C|nr:phage N-6-adenine-methyltransferase [Ferrimonas balearica]MBY6093803.1 phage N-6-adenine-methyltransferase [Ferrimonas balearica]